MAPLAKKLSAKIAKAKKTENILKEKVVEANREFKMEQDKFRHDAKHFPRNVGQLSREIKYFCALLCNDFNITLVNEL